ncbi:MAG: nitrite/sulfite reductase [Deltaproteobacteria bacterium]|nr:MAG: nitrite/sulfite reductase [Deltaproteobacteria bacterium]
MTAPLAQQWKQRLASSIDPALAEEIDAFEAQIELRRQGVIDDKVFAETRLRRGAYGQRYDNGQRHDGIGTRTLAYPSGSLTKGPNTLWDAPGMQRIKLPLGQLTAGQLEVIAELAEEYADGIAHVTTRQDIQLHFVHIDDTPTIMRRLAAVGVTTREACGNSVRNVTACVRTGVCAGECFDTTPHARALARFLLGHPDAQDFGRKFKISFSGCRTEACGLAAIHDLAFVAAVRDGERGFEVLAGGGLGAVPHQAQVLADFVAERDILPLAQAVCRVFARHGEKQNRARARLKFLVAKVGMDTFRKWVADERARLTPDPAWTGLLDDATAHIDGPLKPPSPLPPGPYPPGFDAWRATNVAPQRQPGYSIATVRLPLGDATADQLRALADIARAYTGDTIRATVEQNLALRWVSDGDLPAVYAALARAGLAAAGAGTIEDITACPGTDTCKLGIASSRGLASHLVVRLRRDRDDRPDDVAALRIKASGCFNACGQHHIADIGLLGVSRNVRGRRVPHFQLVLGGRWAHNAGAFGLPIGAIPAKRVGDAIERVVAFYRAERGPGESLHDFFARVGRKRTRDLLADLTDVPPYEEAPELYTDWGDPREYTIGDMGVGECAGEVVSATEFGLADSEREVFEAQVCLDERRHADAAQRAYRAMLEAARALVRMQLPDIGAEPDDIVREFRARFCDTGLFYDPFAGAKFANYLLAMHANPPNRVGPAAARQAVEEAQLFVEAAHACHERIQAGAAA